MKVLPVVSGRIILGGSSNVMFWSFLYVVGNFICSQDSSRVGFVDGNLFYKIII